MSRMVKTEDGWKQTSGNVDYSEINEIKAEVNTLNNLIKRETRQITFTNGNTWLGGMRGYTLIFANVKDPDWSIATIMTMDNGQSYGIHLTDEYGNTKSGTFQVELLSIKS